jgi:hypothetical protein
MICAVVGRMDMFHYGAQGTPNLVFLYLFIPLNQTVSRTNHQVLRGDAFLFQYRARRKSGG